MTNYDIMFILKQCNAIKELTNTHEVNEAMRELKELACKILAIRKKIVTTDGFEEWNPDYLALSEWIDYKAGYEYNRREKRWVRHRIHELNQRFFEWKTD